MLEGGQSKIKQNSVTLSSGAKAKKDTLGCKAGELQQHIQELVVSSTSNPSEVLIKKTTFPEEHTLSCSRDRHRSCGPAAELSGSNGVSVVGAVRALMFWCVVCDGALQIY